MNYDRVPIEIWMHIFSFIHFADFPIDGCFWINKKTRAAIRRLGYDKCCFTEIGHRDKPRTHLQLCEMCNNHVGFECCDLHEGASSLKKCFDCDRLMCSDVCGDYCLNCSDPSDWRKDRCVDCSSHCGGCNGLVCDYCTREMFWCEQCDKGCHKWCQCSCKKKITKI